MTKGNLALSIAFGMAAESLFGLIRMLQLFMVVSMVEINYPANLLYFYNIVVTFAEVDMFRGPEQYEKIFDFKNTTRFSRQFESFSWESMNFFMNSGSIPIFFLLVAISLIFYRIMHCCARSCYQFKFCRKAGIHADARDDIKYPFIKIFMEGYIELALACFIGMLSIVSFIDADSLTEWFATPSEFINSTVTIIIFILIISMPFYVKYEIEKHRNELLEPEILEDYGILYEELNIKEDIAKFYTSF